MKWWYTHCRVLVSESGRVNGQEGLLGTILVASSSMFTKRRRGVEEKVKDVDVIGEREEK